MTSNSSKELIAQSPDTPRGVRAIWRSTTAVALELEPGLSRDEVRRLLRGTAQVVQDHGLARPTIGVLGTASPEISRWSFDAEWHRGDFALYVEAHPDENKRRELVSRRIDDVLDPKYVLPQVEEESREPDEIIEAIQQELNNPDLWPGIEKLLKGPPEQIVTEKGAEKHVESWDRYKWLETWLKEGGNARQVISDSSIAPRMKSPGTSSGDRPSIVRRIKALRASGYRGIPRSPDGESTVSLNFKKADVILLAGANGHGKSAILEALLMGLTGHSFRDLQEIPFRGGDENSTDQSWFVSLDLDMDRPGEDSQPTNPTLELKRQAYTPIYVTTLENGDEWTPTETDRPNWPGTEFSRELQARLAAFLPEHVDKLYDDSAEGRTFYSYLVEARGRLASIRQTQRALQTITAKKTEDLRLEFEKKVLDASDEVGEQKWGSFISHTKPLWNILEELGDVLGQSLIPQEWVSWDHMKKVAEDRRISSVYWRKVIEDARQSVEKSFQNIEQFAKESEAEAGRRIPDLQNNVTTLEKEVDELEILIGSSEGYESILTEWLVKKDLANHERSTLLSLFQTLLDYQDQWSRLPDELSGMTGLKYVVEEMSLLDPGRIKQCCDAVEAAEDSIKLRVEYKAKKENLEAARGELDRAFKQVAVYRRVLELKEKLGLSDDWKNELETPWIAFEKWSDAFLERDLRQEKLNLFIKQVEALENLVNIIHVNMTSQANYFEKTRETTKTILSRFHIAGWHQDEEFKLNSLADDASDGSVTTNRLSLDPRLPDGRGRTAFSTGQKAQVAISFALAQKLLALQLKEPYSPFPNRVMFLDDVSTAYDSTNIVREALVWRQLAYHPDEKKRLQLFICSHHDDLTHRMLELLVPPHGCSMRLFRLEGWSPERGPEITAFDVGTSREDVKAQKLAADLKEVLC